MLAAETIVSSRTSSIGRLGFGMIPSLIDYIEPNRCFSLQSIMVMNIKKRCKYLQ